MMGSIPPSKLKLSYSYRNLTNTVHKDQVARPGTTDTDKTAPSTQYSTSLTTTTFDIHIREYNKQAKNTQKKKKS